MKLIKAFCTVPVISFVAMSAFSEDATPLRTPRPYAGTSTHRSGATFCTMSSHPIRPKMLTAAAISNASAN